MEQRPPPILPTSAQGLTAKAGAVKKAKSVMVSGNDFINPYYLEVDASGNINNPL